MRYRREHDLVLRLIKPAHQRNSNETNRERLYVFLSNNTTGALITIYTPTHAKIFVASTR